MSTVEILDELARLPAQDLEAVYFRASALMDVSGGDETPELLAAIDEAEASYEKEGSVSADEMRSLGAFGTTVSEAQGG